MSATSPGQVDNIFHICKCINVVWVWFWIYASRNANCFTTQQNAMIQPSASALSIVRKLVALVSHLPLQTIAKHVMIVVLN